jgi:hypothetical protein
MPFARRRSRARQRQCPQGSDLLILGTWGDSCWGQAAAAPCSGGESTRREAQGVSPTVRCRTADTHSCLAKEAGRTTFTALPKPRSHHLSCSVSQTVALIR